MSRLIPGYYSHNDLSTKKIIRAIRVSSQAIVGPLVLEAKHLAKKNHILKYNWLQQQREGEQKEERRSQQVRW